MRLLASDVARMLGTQIIGQDVAFSAVSYDSRVLGEGEMFVAIRAERDGHDYARDAVARGASVCLLEKPMPEVPATQIVVDDTVAALGVIAASVREALNSQLDNRIIGVTGSVGKTTTKDMIVAALTNVDWAQPVTASVKSLNNDIGLPVTIINSYEDVKTLVLEMGMRGFGEIDRLCSIAKPIIGVVTRVGDAHSEMVGGIDGVARAKGELIRALPSDGVAVLNFDDPRVRSMEDNCQARVVSYGSSTDSDVSYEIFAMNGMFATVIFEYQGESQKVELGWPGAHMASNAAAACAVAISCGATLASAVSGLSRLPKNGSRIQIMEGINGCTIIDDSYNANPTSVIASLEMLSTATKGKKIAILGVMAEVADEAVAHRQVAQFAAMRGIDVVAVDTPLYGIGSMTAEEAVAFVHSLQEPSHVLVKGSRVAKLERVVRQIVAK